MTTKKTIGAVVLTAGLATVAGGFVLPGATATAATATVASVTAAQVTPAHLPGWPVLRQGTNSAWPRVTVRSLQYLLNAHGAKLTVDGAFGAKTKAAVVSFQKQHHLTADGVVGAKTWIALLVTVKAGSTGPAVRAVQDQANFRNLKNGHSLNVDGIFGPKTSAWVLAFQHAEGFKPDGIVGPLTWQALVTESLSG